MSKRYKKLRKERRFCVVPVDVLLFGEMLLNGTKHYTAEGLPKDAIFVTAEKDITSQTFNFIYLHETFESVPEGQTGKITFVTITTQTKPKEKEKP